jgi:hypothetical protein
MKIFELRPGLQVRHPQHGLGEAKVLTEKTAEILFNEGRRTLALDEIAELRPAEPVAQLEGLAKPLRDLIAEVVEETADRLKLRPPSADDLATEIAPRWIGGKAVLHPRDASLSTKDVEMDVFFRKIVMVRDNLRVLEQKINTHPKLNDAERIELQYYITKSYGSLTTFNLLFREKEQGF